MNVDLTELWKRLDANTEQVRKQRNKFAAHLARELRRRGIRAESKRGVVTITSTAITGAP